MTDNGCGVCDHQSRIQIPTSSTQMTCISFIKSSPLHFPILGVYILIAAGALMMVVGFLGCCGAIKESPCMLGLVSGAGQRLEVASAGGLSRWSQIQQVVAPFL